MYAPMTCASSVPAAYPEGYAAVVRPESHDDEKELFYGEAIIGIERFIG